jgi:hypothetical protein
MLKPILGLAAAGIGAVVLWKVLALLLLPLLGVAIGLVATVVKLVFIAGLVLFVFWLLRRVGRREASAG